MVSGKERPNKPHQDLRALTLHEGRSIHDITKPKATLLNAISRSKISVRKCMRRQGGQTTAGLDGAHFLHLPGS